MYGVRRTVSLHVYDEWGVAVWLCMYVCMLEGTQYYKRLPPHTQTTLDPLAFTPGTYASFLLLHSSIHFVTDATVLDTDCMYTHRIQCMEYCICRL